MSNLKKLVIVSSPTNFAWNGRTLREKPLGGSETACIYVAEYCARPDSKGKREPMDVFVFCTCMKPEKINNVVYAPLEMLDGFLMREYVDYYVVYRYAVPLGKTLNVGKKFLWLQDVDCLVEELHVDYKFENVVCLTPWHRTDFSKRKELPEKVVKCIGNAVTPELYPTEHTVKENMRFFYSSNPIRGMKRLLDIWPSIRKAYPSATLVIYTQLEHCSRVPGLVELVNSMNGKDGVSINDRVPQVTLAREFAKSDYWLYPTAFEETYCITALEAQVCGCIPIYTDVGCLVDTVSDRGIKLENDNSKPAEQTAEILSIIDRLETDMEEKEALRQKGIEFGNHQTWDLVGSQWYSLLTNGTI